MWRFWQLRASEVMVKDTVKDSKSVPVGSQADGWKKMSMARDIWTKEISDKDGLFNSFRTGARTLTC